MKPSIGRIVHYVSYGTPGGEYTSQCRAAIVTAVGSDTSGIPMGCLTVLNPGGMFFKSDVPYDEDGKLGGTWHWPERVD